MVDDKKRHPKCGDCSSLRRREAIPEDRGWSGVSRRGRKWDETGYVEKRLSWFWRSDPSDSAAALRSDEGKKRGADERKHNEDAG